jgi:hypothetical protein
MIFRNLDINGDWTFGKGKNNYLTKSDAIALNVKTRLSSWVNDCFFDMTAGIDWNGRLDKNQNQLLEQNLTDLIAKTDDVTGITSVQSQFNSETRTFNIQYTINTIYTQNYKDKIEVSI